MPKVQKIWVLPLLSIWISVACNVVEFAEEQVNIVTKKKVFFRMALSEGASEKDLEQLFALTPEKMATLSPKELKSWAEKFRFYIGTDGSTWALMTDTRGVKEVFGFEKGEFSLGMAMSDSEGLWFLVSLVLYDRAET